MIGRYLIKCDVERPELPFCPLSIPCGSARTLGVTGLPRQRLGVTVKGCRVRITNADGVAMTREAVYRDGAWCVTFPAAHFQAYGDVKRGVIVMAYGSDENGEDQVWVERFGDLRIMPLDASARPGDPSAAAVGRDVYHKSKVVDGVQHYKKEVISYDEDMGDWGASYVGDYIIVGGDYVPA